MDSTIGSYEANTTPFVESSTANTTMDFSNATTDYNITTPITLTTTAIETFTTMTINGTTPSSNEQDGGHGPQNMNTINMVQYVCAVVGTIFILLGLVGNTLSILVWRRKAMRTSTGTYLIGQAIADMGLLVFFFSTENLPILSPGLKANYQYGVFFTYLGYPMFYYFLVCSIWFLVGVTIDRYIQVCWITKAKTLCSERRSVIALVTMATLNFIINIPHFKTYEPVPDDERSIHQLAYRKSSFGKSPGSHHYEFWVHCIFLVLGPWLLILILNGFIIRQVARLRKQVGKRASSYGREKSKRSESQLTRILLLVSFVFLIFIFPECLVKCFYMLKAGHPDTVSKALSIAKTGVVINSSINFCLYCLSGKKFRKELRLVVCTGYHGDRESKWNNLSYSGSSTTLTRTKSSMSTASAHRITNNL